MVYHREDKSFLEDGVLLEGLFNIPHSIVLYIHLFIVYTGLPA